MFELLLAQMALLERSGITYVRRRRCVVMCMDPRIKFSLRFQYTVESHHFMLAYCNKARSGSDGYIRMQVVG